MNFLEFFSNILIKQLRQIAVHFEAFTHLAWPLEGDLLERALKALQIHSQLVFCVFPKDEYQFFVGNALVQHSKIVAKTDEFFEVQIGGLLAYGVESVFFILRVRRTTVKLEENLKTLIETLSSRGRLNSRGVCARGWAEGLELHSDRIYSLYHYLYSLRLFAQAQSYFQQLLALLQDCSYLLIGYGGLYGLSWKHLGLIAEFQVFVEPHSDFQYFKDVLEKNSLQVGIALRVLAEEKQGCLIDRLSFEENPSLRLQSLDFLRLKENADYIFEYVESHSPLPLELIAHLVEKSLKFLAVLHEQLLQKLLGLDVCREAVQGPSLLLLLQNCLFRLLADFGLLVHRDFLQLSHSALGLLDFRLLLIHCQNGSLRLRLLNIDIFYHRMLYYQVAGLSQRPIRSTSDRDSGVKQ